MPPVTYLSDEQMARIRQAWNAGASRSEVIALAGGIAGCRIFDRGIEARGKGRFAHPSLVTNPLPDRRGQGGGRPVGYRVAAGEAPAPTPAEIATAARAIRRAWDADTRQERRYRGAPDLLTWQRCGREVDAATRERRQRHLGERQREDARCKP